jgi:PucR C-terminal helix-turn-helix domain
MNRYSQGRSASSQLRTRLVERLRARRPEIEQTILTRVYSISDPTQVGDPEYVEGLRAAVSAALSYGLAGIETGSPQPGPIPAELLTQARHASRSGVSLDTVLRRYFAGFTLLGDFIIREAEQGESLGAEELRPLERTRAACLDRLVDAVSAEYAREAEGRVRSPEQRRAECVERLLAGEFADASELAYDLDGWQLGAVAAGSGAEEALRGFATTLDRQLLLVPRGEGILWAWLGGGRRIGSEDVERIGRSGLSAQTSLALGEQARGLVGWRLTHHQASAAQPIALRAPGAITRYSDVALLASMVQDEVLSTSLNDLYLTPLSEERDGGEALRQTLRAYFAAGRSVSSTAASLGIGRNAVTNRLRKVERRIGRQLDTCAAEVEAVLLLEEFESRVPA